jgi:hypothetical protein
MMNMSSSQPCAALVHAERAVSVDDARRKQEDKLWREGCTVKKERRRVSRVYSHVMGIRSIRGGVMMDSIFGYDSFDQLALAAFLYVLIRLIRSENRRLWIMLGLIGGVSCMIKVTILYLAPGLLVALLASKQQKQLLTRWPWAELGAFLVPISPYLVTLLSFTLDEHTCFWAKTVTPFQSASNPCRSMEHETGNSRRFPRISGLFIALEVCPRPSPAILTLYPI